MNANRGVSDAMQIYNSGISPRNRFQASSIEDRLHLPGDAATMPSRGKYKLSPVNPGYAPHGNGYMASDDEPTDMDSEDYLPTNRKHKWIKRRSYRQRHEEDFSPAIPLPSNDDETMFKYRPPKQTFEAEPDNRRRSRFSTKVVTFYRNGDKHFQGVALPINGRSYANWDALITVLNKKISLPYGVRNIYSLNGDRIKTLSDLTDGRAYVCASGQYNSQIPYGKAEFADRYWNNRKPSAGANRHTDRKLRKIREDDSREGPNDQRHGAAANLVANTDLRNSLDSSTAVLAIEASVSKFAKPKVIEVISNTHRGSRAKILLNPRTTQSFEQVLKDMTQAVVLSNPPVKQLYTWRTEEKVLSFTQLFRDFRDHSKFIACGLEALKRTTHLQQRSVEDEVIPNQRIPASMIPKEEAARIIGMPEAGRYVHKFQKWKKIVDQPELRVGTFVTRGYPHDDIEADFEPRRQSILDRSPPLPPLKPKRAFGGNSSEDESPRDTGVPFRRKLPGRTSYSEQLAVKQKLYSTVKKMSAPNALVRNPDTASINNRGAIQVLPQNGKLLNRRQTVEQIEDIIEEEPPIEQRIIDKKRKTKDAQVNNVAKQRRKVLAPPLQVEINGELKEFHAPTNVEVRKESSYKPPNKKLKLEWVYGYRGFDTDNNLFVLANGECLYSVGAVAVLYDRDLDQQRFYVGHNEDIQAMCVHPAGNYIATAQISGQVPESMPPDIAICHSAHVRVWEVETLHTHAILGLDFFEVGIACLAFSRENNGEWLMAVDQGSKHTISVWDWNDDYLMVKSREYTLFDGTGDPAEESNAVLVGSFHPFDDSVLVTAGRQHIHVWRFNHNKLFRDKRSGIFEEEQPSYVTSLEFSHTGDVLTGDSSGNINVWEKDHDSAFRQRYRIHRAHEGSIYALRMLEDGTLLSGGGLDRRLLAWDSLHGYTSAKVERLFPENAGGIRTIAIVSAGTADGDMLIGTTRNHLMGGSLQNKFIYVSQGHSDELWGLDTHPQGPAFVTAGRDASLQLWRADTHKIVWKIHVEKACSTCAFHPSGNVIAVGTVIGRFMVHTSSDGMHVTSVQVSKEQIGMIKFSPDGLMLAVGCHDNKIYIYTVMDDGQVYRKQGILKGHSSFIRHLDWSTDSCFLQSVSGNNELLFWNVHDAQTESATGMRDVEWETQTCTLGYTVAGIWPTRDEALTVHCADRSHHQQLLVTGDSCGRLSLFKYPCSSQKNRANESKLHSSDVGVVKFLHDDNYVITTGGRDAVLLQWAVVDKNPSAYHAADKHNHMDDDLEAVYQK